MTIHRPTCIFLYVHKKHTYAKTEWEIDKVRGRKSEKEIERNSLVLQCKYAYRYIQLQCHIMAAYTYRYSNSSRASFFYSSAVVVSLSLASKERRRKQALARFMQMSKRVINYDELQIGASCAAGLALTCNKGRPWRGLSAEYKRGNIATYGTLVSQMTVSESCISPAVYPEIDGHFRRVSEGHLYRNSCRTRGHRLRERRWDCCSFGLSSVSAETTIAQW